MSVAKLAAVDSVKTSAHSTDKELQKVLQQRGFRLGRTIGGGSYSKVRTAWFRRPRGRPLRCACKQLDCRQAPKDFVARFLPRELEVLRAVTHPHIVQIFDVVGFGSQIFIFMELCEKGDLLEHIRARRGPLSEQKARLYFSQIVSAVDYLHSQDISHRDVKCENILLASNECVKLTDFGFARCCTDENNRRVLSRTFCGSAAYAAPEILQGKPYNPKLYDAWSLGVVLFVMLTASMPFDDTNSKAMLYAQLCRVINFPKHCEHSVSMNARELVRRLLEPDVTRRATVKHIKQNAWLKNEL
ncbi:testis-specific serine/threonine-protein kinase 3-like [Schistocerca piceifrons]|uniref:testis-specific serine/threonine-protein kinase 3-like n=1 Tax=Schistocerca piceifrons TaxID=274613 RepID=UPI001F5FA2E8|nr:testis-specific serine/threonine-protein kinase 3-like [Schistocerca piceifrons]XP_049958128.1 testis-specific serine/threonine-protein kinase 3-like [Schistocerca serialis cubense]